ncbi:MAG: hypothetical protein N2689_12490 [Verrucomicrobiae bacterium]|nr:hypothetical protein [Verrucomicrobiae bacterium]
MTKWFNRRWIAFSERDFVAVAVALICTPALADPAPPPNDIFPLAQIRSGLKGKVHTVMQGAEVVPLEVEIYGVLRGFIGPKMDLIIGKLVDEKTKLTGAVHGMSGSPLYIEGKVAGALSYRLTQFEKEGWCGFTPIEGMLETDVYARKSSAERRRLEPQPSRKRIVGAGVGGAAAVSTGADVDFQLLPRDAGGFRPLALPLTVGGVSPKVFDWLRAQFVEHGFDGRLLPVMGGGGEDGKPLDGAFGPGAAVAGVIATGDLHAAATGTLTWRNGNRVLGFGHPFLKCGKIAMPMARAEIVATVSSFAYPHKLSNTRQIVGPIYEDRLTAIAGEIGPVPPMPDVKVRLRGSHGERTFRSRLFQHDELTPRFAATCMAQVLNETLDYSREFTLTLQSVVELSGHQKIRLENLYSGVGGDHFAPANDFVASLAEVFDNRFEMPQIERIQIEIEVADERRIVELGEVFVDREKAKPGETVTLHAMLKPWRGDRRVQTMSFTVPENIRGGELDVLIGDAAAADALDGKSGRSRFERPQSLSQLINVLNQRRRHDALYLRVTRRGDGIVIADQRMPGLPPSAMALYDSSRTVLEATRLEREDVLEQRWPQNAVVRGSRTLKLKVE